MEIVRINGKVKEVPTTWAELQAEPKLFLKIIKLFFLGLKKQELRNAAGMKLVGLSDIKAIRITNVLENPNKNKQAETVGSNLFRISELAKFVTNTQLEITRNHFKKIFKCNKLLSPDSIYKHFTAWEYALCEKSFFDFVEIEQEEDLNYLIAIIYRPQKWFIFIRKHFKNYDTDKRQKLAEIFLKKRAKRIAKLPYEVRWLIFRWFAYQREIILKAHPYTFKGSKKESKKIDVGTIWTDTILAMSEVGDEDKTANTKLSIILRRIENDNRDYEESKNESDG